MKLLIILLDSNGNDPLIAWGTVGLAIIALIAIVVQICWNRTILKNSNMNAKSQMALFSDQLKNDNENAFKYSSVKLVLNFDERFNELVKDRKEVAKIIIANNILARESIDRTILDKKIDDIYDLFDSLGYFINRKYIKAEVVHQYFDYWISRYYEFYKLYQIKSSIPYEDSVWNNLPTLSRYLDIEEMGPTRRSREKIDKVELERFFKEEMDLKE